MMMNNGASKPTRGIVAGSARSVLLTTLACASLAAGVLVPAEAVGQSVRKDQLRPHRPSTIGAFLSHGYAMSYATLDKGYLQTYDPYILSTVNGSLTWQPLPALMFSASSGIATELTNSNFTTTLREPQWNDSALAVSSPGLYTVPVVDVIVSPSASVLLPTSPLSQAATMNAAVAPALTLTRNFGVLSGARISARGEFTFFSHDDQIPGFETRPTSCSGGANCQAYTNITGAANAYARQTYSVSGMLLVHPQVALSAGFTAINSQTYSTVVDEDETYDLDPTTFQNVNITSAAVTYIPWRFLNVSLGYNALHRIGPDGQYVSFLSPRFGTFSANVNLNVAQLTGMTPQANALRPLTQPDD